MEINKQGYLKNDNKAVAVQIENKIFLLKHWETVDNPRKLDVILDKYDVRLLKDSEYQGG